jgi:hydrogenase maturation protease
MSDEGVGVRVLQRLSDFADEFPLVDFVDAGTGGMSILHLISGKNKAIFIDCAKMGDEPGTIKKFTPQEIKSTKALAHQSLHETDIIKIINIADKLGQCPAEIVMFGIEPQAVKPCCELSKLLSDRIDEYATVVRNELSKTISAPP